MDKKQFAAIKACCVDCALYFAKGQPGEPTRDEMVECVDSMSAPEILAMHKQDKEWTRGILKDDIVCSYFRKHGLSF